MAVTFLVNINVVNETENYHHKTVD